MMCKEYLYPLLNINIVHFIELHACSAYMGIIMYLYIYMRKMSFKKHLSFPSTCPNGTLQKHSNDLGCCSSLKVPLMPPIPCPHHLVLLTIWFVEKMWSGHWEYIDFCTNPFTDDMPAHAVILCFWPCLLMVSNCALVVTFSCVDLSSFMYTYMYPKQLWHCAIENLTLWYYELPVWYIEAFSCYPTT